MTSGILFDFNGVIVDDEAQHCEALTATLAEHGYTLSPEAYYREYLGLDDRECFRLTFGRLGLPHDEMAVRQAVARKHAIYQETLRRSMQLVPGVVDFIEDAALDGFQLAIVSGALRSEIDLILNESGLRPHFAEIIAAEDVAVCKPDPSGFNRAREMLELAPHRCVVLEDSLPGLRAARAAGIRCAMLATSHPEDACRDADLVWRDFVGHEAAELPWAHV
jgi:HAD superfamily hydrolase (TIGR01509 family)